MAAAGMDSKSKPSDAVLVRCQCKTDFYVLVLNI